MFLLHSNEFFKQKNETHLKHIYIQFFILFLLRQTDFKKRTDKAIQREQLEKKS